MQTNKEIINSLPFVKEFEKDKIDFLFTISELIEKPKRYILTKQFEQSHSFYFLLEGLVNFSISVEDKTDELSVGKSSEKFTPIGWSGFRNPKRYATTVRCEEHSFFIKWSHQNLEKFFEKEPRLGREFILFVLKKSVDLLHQVRIQLIKYNNTNWDIELGKTVRSIDEGEDISVPDPLTVLMQSPFFEVFPENIIRKLAKVAHKRWHLSGETIFNQGEIPKGIDILAYGKAVLCFAPESLNNNQVKIDESVALGLINHPGYFVGWVGADPSLTNDITAVASRNSVIYHISRYALDKILNQNPELALTFAKRLLWLVSIRLRNARAGLISQSYEREILAINNLIEQNSTQLSVNSPLHKVPHLLDNALTLDDAFQLLFKLEKEGGSLERGLARLSFDILGKVYKEYNFFEGLKYVYQSVTEAPKSLEPNEIRVLAAKQFIGIFEQIPYVIEGWENLPDKPGQIFIYNHLVNHPYNTLPNNFQITLDSHFISSIILYSKYGEACIRLVRVPKVEEYGHENYYDRLGYINVYTKESEITEETPQKKKTQRKKFFKEAGEYVKKGFNIVISPEGTSLRTNESPGPFKPGAFLLAASIKPEPYIVPIALANFDKRINQNIFSLIIKKPFRISDHVKNPEKNKDELFEFINNYRKKYRGYVEEAIDLAKQSETSKLNLKTFEQVRKDSLIIDKNLFEQDIKILERRHVGKLVNPTIFYGSSSFRLWKSIKKDFPGHNILNLSFGGSRIDYCLYYFDRLIKPNKVKSLIFYAGDNDIGDGRLPKQILNSFLAFYNKFRESYPKTKFTFVSIKPSPERFPFLDRIKSSNNLIKQFLSQESNTFYLNVYDDMLNINGDVKKDLFTDDKLHMNKKGFALWKKIFLSNEKEIF